MFFQSIRIKGLRVLGRVICNLLYHNIKSTFTIFDEEWDSLIFLDACRYETFRKIIKKVKIKGRLEFRISKGSDTPSFLKENFQTRHRDLIIVTANPFVDKIIKNKVYRVISSWSYGWANDLNTVDPRIVYLDALSIIKKYPNKKLIIFFLQPHSPYPNGTGETCAIQDFQNVMKNEKQKSKYKINEKFYVDDWHYVDFRHLPVKKLKEGYLQNLRLVMPYVKKLVNILPGRTVITSDHGDCFGEKIHPFLPLRIYGHPRWFKFPTLIKVPWFVVEPTKKKKVDIDKELKKLKTKILKERLREKIKEIRKSKSS